MSLPGRSSFHALVPEGGQLIPRGVDLVVQVVFLAHLASVEHSPVRVSGYSSPGLTHGFDIASAEGSDGRLAVRRGLPVRSAQRSGER